jgi:RNA polymerase sigma-54 factor
MVELRVDLNVNVGLVLTPNIDLSLKILAMNVLEVEEKLKEISEENPLIKIDDDIGIKKYPMDDNKKFRELDESYKEHFHNDESIDLLEATVAESETLTASLMKQVDYEYDFKERDRKLAEFIVFNLNEKGFLEAKLDDISKKFNETVSHVDKIRKKIMQLEPLGCGSFNAIEFLKFQADSYESSNIEHLYELIDALYSTTSPNIKKIKDKLNIDDELLREIFTELSNFSIYPLENYAVSDNRIYIEPDVYIKKVGGRHIAILNEKNLSRVNIDENLFREYSDNDEAKTFLEEKYKQAKQFIVAIAQRNKTLLKTVNLIIERQDRFFEDGVIMPLTRKDIALNLGYNVSTITRAVSNKYVDYEGRIIPLKEFFSFGVGEGISKNFIKSRIKDILAKEDKDNPLNDDQIKHILEKNGISVTRRTITKYRKEMNIPNSRQRRCQII